MVHRNRRVVHMYRMNHRNWVHRIFALNTNRLKIASHKGGFLAPTFMDTGEVKVDKDLGRGDEGEVGALELLDRVKLIEMSVPSRMLFLAFNLLESLD